MEETIKGILLSNIKHSDRANVITLYTREKGRVAVVSPVGTGRAARIRAARLQLLSAVEATLKVKAGRELPVLATCVPLKVWHTLYFDPVKCSILFFLSDFLGRFLREAPSEPLMWDYIISELEQLDGMDGKTGNFHLEFLLGIIEIGGILPDEAGWRRGYSFDYKGGEFVAVRGTRSEGLPPEEAAIAAKLLRIGRKGIGRVKMGKGMRAQILRKLLDYIDYHYPGTGSVSSLEVLRELF